MACATFLTVSTPPFFASPRLRPAIATVLSILSLFLVGSASAAFDLRITEAWPGNSGANITVDWFEISNLGTTAWTAAGGPTLYYNDNSFSAAGAVPINGLTNIQPGESVIVVIGNSVFASDFSHAWSNSINLTGVEIGYAPGGAALGQDGDGVGLWVGGPSGPPTTQISFPGGLNNASWDADPVVAGVSSVGNASGAVANVNNTSVIASPGHTASGGPVDPNAPVITVSSTSQTAFNIPAGISGYVSGVISDPTDPAATVGIQFTVTDANNAVGTLTVGATSSNPGVVPNSNLVLTGSGGTRMLKIIPVGVGTAHIIITVTDPTSKTDTYVINYAASAASSTPAVSRYHTGASDASTVIDVNGLMVVGDDEDQVIRIYDRNTSGPPVASYDFNANLGLTAEADLEASFRSGNRIYWIGSHGNDTDGVVQPSRNAIFSTDIGSGLTFVHSYTNMRADLIAWDAANGHGLGSNALGFTAGTMPGILPTYPNGFNIEGAALADGGQVYLGFRSPLSSFPPQQGRALLVPVNNFQAVVDGAPGPMTFGAPIFLELHDRAIRSISENGLGDFLILAGDVSDGGETFEFFLWDGNPADQPTQLSSTLNDIAVDGAGSPESIVNFHGKLYDGATVDIMLDNGDTDYYANGAAAKHLVGNWQKSRSDTVTFTGLPPLVVTTLTDETNGLEFGGVSLREAIGAAQPGTKITFDPGLSGGTINLGSELIVSNAISISGSGLPRGIVISGGNSNRVFHVISTGSLTLDTLTIANGNAATGGGVVNAGGNLNILNCTITGNTAAEGAGLYSDTDLTIKRTTLTNCTLHGNLATGHGGGAYNFDGRLSLFHCTVTGNSAPAGQGGGLASYGDNLTPTTVSASIVRENLAGDMDYVIGGLNSFTSAGANLVGSGTAITVFNQAGDLAGTTTSARLSPLGYYGGPTPTRHPLANSPALNAAPFTTLTNDQRGFLRSVGAPDIGAVEAGPVTLVNNIGDSAATATTLRKAIADITTPGAVIRFNSSIFNGEPADQIIFGSRITLSGKSFLIDASDISGGVTLVGGGTTNLFSVLGSAELALDSLTLTGGTAGNDVGGAIANFGTTTAANCMFTGNSAGFGGAVGSIYGLLSFANCTFYRNSAAQGGAVYTTTDLTDRGANFVNCTFHGNTATSWGGALYNAGHAQVTHGTITANSAPAGFGGGIATSGATPTRTELHASIVRDNLNGDVDYVLGATDSFASLGWNLVGSGTATVKFNQPGDQTGTGIPLRLSPPGYYGGLTLTRHPMANSPVLDGATATALTTDQRGFARSVGVPDIGAVEAGSVTLVNNSSDSIVTFTTLRKAIADATNGSVIRFDPSVFNGEPADTITFGSEIAINGKSLFIDASGIAAGVSLNGNSVTRLFNLGSSTSLGLDSLSLINGNSSNNVGGAILLSGGVNLNLNRCLVASNTAGSSIGGGVMSFDGRIFAFNSTFAANNASDGGAIWAQGPLELTHVTIAATNRGNYAVVSFAGSKLENSIIAANSGNNIFEAGTLTQLGNNQLSGNPLLAPLYPYGGPTRTMPPLPGSPAIEGAVFLATTPTTDQRGAPRPRGAFPDLGAVEAVAFSSLGLPSNDGDNIPDILEGPGGAYPQLSPLVNDANRDTDGDGSTDANEIANMTNPLDPDSVFRIKHFGVTSGPSFNTADVTFNSFPGLHYTAEISTDVTFTSPRAISLGNPTEFLSEYSLILLPTEHFIRIRRD